MGHIGNAYLLRLGNKRFWQLQYIKKKEKNFIDLEKYIKNIFVSKMFFYKRYIYSHVVISFSKKVTIDIYLYNTYLDKFFKSLYFYIMRKYVLEILLMDKENLNYKLINMKKYIIKSVKNKGYIKNKKQKLRIKRKNMELFRINKKFKKLFWVKLKTNGKLWEMSLVNRLLFVMRRLRYFQERVFILMMKKDIKNIFKIKSLKIKLNFIPSIKLNAHIITTYFAERLRQRYKLGFLIKNMLYHLKKIYRGVKITCQGRFTRAQRARSLKTIYGKVPFSNMGAYIDYSFKKVRLKYGVCGVKVWIYYPVRKWWV